MTWTSTQACFKGRPCVLHANAKQASTKKRVHTLIDEVERQMEALPEKKVRDETSDDVSVTTPADFAEWKRKILENAAKANS
ncbi:hypothetical protein DPMN_174801 [Dreissena polymorpha]|uniref:Uncharacterized protein n=1 Tax=Dreissena polymorpha TaxID=45954 RepID=A0A9D4E6N3_DREPO|nr:hypothetical protein DPMN_174801 [Dreissena polymorpha]